MHKIHFYLALIGGALFYATFEHSKDSRGASEVGLGRQDGRVADRLQDEMVGACQGLG